MVVEHVDRVVAPAPILLADQAVQQAVLDPFQLDRQRVEGHGLQAIVERSLFKERHRALAREDRPQTHEEPAVQVGVGEHGLFDHLHAQVDVVVAGDRRHDLDIRARDAILEATNTLFEVERARHARQQRDLAGSAHFFDQEVGGGHTTGVVVHAEVGEAVRVGRVGVPGHDRDACVDRRIDRVHAAVRVVAAHADGVHALRDRVLDHARLLGHVRVHRTEVQALDLDALVQAAHFFGSLHAAVAAKLKHRVVQRLGNPREGERVILSLGDRRAVPHREGRGHHHHQDQNIN